MNTPPPRIPTFTVKYVTHRLGSWHNPSPAPPDQRASAVSDFMGLYVHPPPRLPNKTQFGRYWSSTAVGIKLTSAFCYFIDFYNKSGLFITQQTLTTLGLDETSSALSGWNVSSWNLHSKGTSLSHLEAIWRKMVKLPIARLPVI